MKTKKLIFWSYVISVLFILRFGGFFPTYFIHIKGLLRFPEIGFIIGLLILLFYNKKLLKSDIPKSISYTYIILLIFIFLETLRTIIIYDQSFLGTIKTIKFLFYGIFMFITPLIISTKEKLFKFMKILFYTSTLCLVLFFYQFITKTTVFDTWSKQMVFGNITLFRTLEHFPFLYVFFTFSFIYYLINKEKHNIKDWILLILSALGLIAVIINVTRTFWIAYFFCFIILLILSKKKYIIKHSWFFIILLLFVLISYQNFDFIQMRGSTIYESVSTKSDTFGYRMGILNERWEIVKDTNILLGAGLVNNDNTAFDNYYQIGGPNSNNYALNQFDIGFSGLIGQLGVLGIIIYLSFIYFCMYFIFSGILKIKNLIFKSINVGLFLSCCWVCISTFQNPGIYGDYLLFIFLSVGLSKSIRIISSLEEKKCQISVDNNKDLHNEKN